MTVKDHCCLLLKAVLGEFWVKIHPVTSKDTLTPLSFQKLQNFKRSHYTTSDVLCIFSHNVRCLFPSPIDLILLCCPPTPSNSQEDEVTLTLEPESGSPLPTTTQPSPRDIRSPSSADGPTPGPPGLFAHTVLAAAAEPGTEHALFEVTSCAVRSFEGKDEEAPASAKEEGSVVFAATN